MKLLEISPNRIFGLDLLRMIAIMFVFFSHNEPLLPSSIAKVINTLYFDGVTIFFVLSGFLIGKILINTFEKKGLSFGQIKDFWIRRWFRTLPPYFLFAFIIAIISKIFVIGFPLRIILPYIIFCQNITTNASGFFGESWSLAIEEWFYLLTPIFIFIFSYFLKLRKSFLITIIIFIFISPIIRYYKFAMGDLPPIFYQIVMYRSDSIIYGVLGAYISIYHNKRWLDNKKTLLFLGLVLLIIWKFISIYFSTPFYIANINFPFFSIATLCLIPYLSTYRLKKYKNHHKIIIYISLISYSLYLIHYSLVEKIIIKIVVSPILKGYSIFNIYLIENLLYWTLSFIGAFITYKYFEIPTTNLREYFTKNILPKKIN